MISLILMSHAPAHTEEPLMPFRKNFSHGHVSAHTEESYNASH